MDLTFAVMNRRNVCVTSGSRTDQWKQASPERTIVEELDIPISIDVGIGPPGAPYVD